MNKYDYSKVKYVKCSEKVCVICPEHGEFWVSPNNHCNGKHKQGCPKCGKLEAQKDNKKRLVTAANSFIQKAQEIHGDKYDYSKVIYKGAHKKVCLICPEHGEFWQTPDKHINAKQGCPKCKESLLEKEVRLLLDCNNIYYEQEYSAKWLGKQRLDFYLPNYGIAIECQGEQHYRPIDFANKGNEWAKKSFLQTLKNDYNKKRKLIENNIELIYYTKPELKQINEFIDKEDLLTYIKNKKMNEQETFQTTMGINFTNFDVNNIQEAETINVVFVIDKSSSTNRFINDLNNTLNEFLHEFQRSHVASKMLISVIEFNDKIDVVSAFQPISDLKDFNVQPYGCTNLYGAVLAGLENAVQYRKDLENNGISVKTLVFIITDGEDNEGVDPSLVKQKIDEIYQDESNCFSFTVMMFGLGDEANFDEAREKMGIKPEMLGKLGATAKDLRKMVSFISSSVSSSASGQNVSAITF